MFCECTIKYSYVVSSLFLVKIHFILFILSYSYCIDTSYSFLGYSSRGIKLTTDLNVVLRLRITEAFHPLPIMTS